MRWLTAGVVLGVGLGGFLDGIVLHQIAQWHSMGSAILPPTTMHAMSVNMSWDGLFHLLAWTLTVLGVFMFWSEARRGDVPDSARMLIGQLIFGWGGFNLVEGVINHHLLALHHVRDLPVHVPLYDWAFLATGGLGFLVVGALLMRPERRAIAADRLA
jgi:uncharacterized membrane protein